VGSSGGVRRNLSAAKTGIDFVSLWGKSIPKIDFFGAQTEDGEGSTP
jgi:hypothetical protein